MERFSLVHVAPLSALVSLWYFSRAWETHALPARPQLSTYLLLLLSSACCYFISHLIRTNSSVESLFEIRRSRSKSTSALHDDDSLYRNGVEEVRPPRPKQWTLTILVAIIATRIEFFHYAKSQQQCNSFGHGYWIWPGLVLYQYIASIGFLQDPNYGQVEDPWHSELDDWLAWLESDAMRHVIHITLSVVFALAAGTAANQFAPSTYMCLPSVDSAALISYVQNGSILLDLAIAVLSWQQLIWAKSSRDRMQTLAKVLALTCLSTFTIDILVSLWGSRADKTGDVPSLYGYDIFMDGIALTVLLVSSALWICDANLTTPVGIATAMAGVWKASSNGIAYGDWEQLSKIAVLFPLFVVTGTTVAFTYARRLRTVVFLPRGAFNWIVGLFALLASLNTLLSHVPVYERNHPINQIMYSSGIDFRHWSVKASTSSTSRTAIRIYQDRHGHRKAPPLFKEWYAQLQHTKIRDNFPQIDDDLAPFWHVTPKDLRDAIEEASRLPGVATLVIKDGEASTGRNDASTADPDDSLTKLVRMASNFSSLLPDMVIPVNIARSPRILPRWENRWSISRASEEAAVADVISGRSPRQAEMSAAHETPSDQQVTPQKRGNAGSGDGNAMTAGEFRAMLRQACPSNSASRANPYWNKAGFCRRCAKGHSTLQLMSDWHASLESLCSQPDLKNLHGFYMSPPDVRPVQKLLPLFSLYKTAHFADILLPLSPNEEAPAEAGVQSAPDQPYLDRSDSVSWSGSVGRHPITPEYLHGHQKLRLLGQLTRPQPADKTTLIKPIREENREWVYAKRPTVDVNQKLPLDVGISDYTACTGHGCDDIKQLFGEGGHSQPASDDSAPPQKQSKMVLLLDEDDGPAPDTLRALRTETLPVISTIFKTWYTSRLQPWVHFVPLDVRYQALHTTLAYFTVLEDRRDSGVMDSKSVAQQGKSWTKEALRERDQELYLFRLLIEWARLIDDERDDIGL